MIRIVYGHESPISIVTILFYTCMWAPFLEIKRSMLKIMGLVLSTCHWGGSHQEERSCVVDLPVARYKDLQRNNNDNWGRDEVCSVCLVEFEGEDAVNQLTRCRHVFHMGCIDGWLCQNRFTCPLCRSFLLVPCK